ncbi:Pentatricopeptide repeat-containing protein, chloroplastic [Vitis vinifera]|uniref:Pentatricopeptide repeat-containing protein, chloroplastic n=1 Tax=Vitis vinifera TaxID=29760 RepID=A0A438IWG1_VITVI|nr:Pentatricopeptide repeat-containing protein, chloroplastic [Vitis vinifera]
MLVSATSNQPWNSTHPTLILLPKSKTLHDVNQIHSRLITTGFINNPSLTTRIILNFSSSSHKPLVEFARYLFMSRHFGRKYRKQDNPFLWNAIIKSFSHGEDPREAFVIFNLMLENGVCVDKFSFSLVLKACSRLGLIKEGMQIHGLLGKMEIGSDVFLQNCLMCLYLRCGCLGIARQLFDRMMKRDSVSFNSMIDGYVKHGMWVCTIGRRAQGCLGVVEEMPKRDLISWNSMIDGCVKCGKMENAHHLFNRMPKRDVVSWANMVDGYAKLGEIDIARGLFDEMPERDVISCNAMMAGYVQNGHLMEALNFFHDMLSRKELFPDNATLLITLSAIAQLGHFDEGVALHCYIEDNGFSLSEKLGVALIDMYAKCGNIDNALSVFEDIDDKSIDHWNAIIGGLAIHGLGEVAFELFMEMEKLFVKPDDITFIGVLNACNHAGLVKEGLMCFELMRRVHKVEPKLQHYGCMVDILGRAGHVEEAKKFVEKMPIEPNDVVWRTLLSACRNHENFTIGEPVAKHLISVDSYNPSSYVLLSNIYAGFGMWNDVYRIRMMMKQRDLKKIPGCSQIELEGNIHEFFVRDKSHPQVREIYSMLDSLSALNSEVAYCKH